ncbi:filamentous hemagglutinin family outer membrane protein [Chondrocystis sp. NIES-4102]|nr:filamentous hemagglutinin family outer membrane protein [Chondrocystis sp. NIES-4102]
MCKNKSLVADLTYLQFTNLSMLFSPNFNTYQLRIRFFKYIQLEIFRCIILSGIVNVVTLFNFPSPVKAQITADETVNTQVENSANVYQITGGTTRGSNLFHSFQEFSVPTDNIAAFNNASDIENIIGRVTGENISNIDGLIQANGQANLILINPQGINFGNNAQLSIGGSFLATTADTLIFEDGTYSTKDLSTSPLLSVNVPVGLQLGQNSGTINVQGTGHNLSLETPIFTPFIRGEVSGLKVQPGESLGLVGGNITFNGGVLTAEAGNIELGSVETGIVGLDFAQQGFSLAYQDIPAFKNIELAQRALIDVSGNTGGKVNIQGRQVQLTEGSVVLIQNFGNEESGKLNIKATEGLRIDGVTSDGLIASGLFTEALASGKGSDVEIETANLELTGAGSILTITFGTAASGDIKLTVGEGIKIEGYAAINPNKFTIISAQTFGVGDAGAINVETKNFTALNGGNIASLTGGETGTGSGGNVNINAQESIELSGVNPIAFAPSQITAGSGGAGSAGNVNLTTKRLLIKDGGRVDASATDLGDAGNVRINASESIEVTGTVPNSLNPSLIIASANILDPELRELLKLPSVPSGDSGSVTIDTPQLKIGNGGLITVRNDGTGDAGNLQVKTQVLDLSDEGGITGVVQNGRGGEIELEVADSLRLTRGGKIVSDNLGAGDGGRINITANNLNISDRSYISTTSFGSGRSGDINLNVGDSLDIQGSGFRQFQQDFQAASLDGTLQPGTKGTGIFIGSTVGGRGGELKIQTNSLNLTSGGIIFNPIFNSGISGNIEIITKDLNIEQSALQISSVTQSTNAAQGGDIIIEAERLKLRNGGTIANATYGGATGGNIDIAASESVTIQDTPQDSLLFTGIYSNTSIGNGNGGNIDITTGKLSIRQGIITSNTGAYIQQGLKFGGGGDGGDISIQVDDSIDISGVSTSPRVLSGISASSFGNGNAGNVDISTSKLSVRDGAEISAAALSSGAGGNLTVNASDSIQLFGGTTLSGQRRGGLVADSGRDGFFEQRGSGSSGDIKITTGNLTISEGASINVQSLGAGQAGNLNIEAKNTVLLTKEGTISAATNFNTGGDINLKAKNLFVLGGSQFIADANAGRGGNIDINTQGLIVCGDCRLSASAELGVDGVVRINTLNPDSNVEIVDMPTKLTKPQEAVALACAKTNQANSSQLTITGRGGLPPRPNEVLTSESLINFNNSNAQSQSQEDTFNSQLPAPARNWYINSAGKVVLTSQATINPTQFNSLNCDVR